MKKLYTACIALVVSMSATAQQVPKKVIAEYFTNTYCSICANKNPGFFSNLAGFPQVLHISYYPSAPYPACPLSQQNVAEQDARTNEYGIYGATPQLVVQGTVLPSSNYTDPNIFQSQLGQMTSFYMHTSITSQYDTAVIVRIMIRKVDTSSIAYPKLYGAIAEDTLSFAANNGETKQYDVFRRSIVGAQPLTINALVNVGDSVVYNQPVSLAGVTDIHNVFAITMLQDGNHNMLQAAKSANLVPALRVNNIVANSPVIIYPNPADNELYVRNASFPMSGSIMNITGQVLATCNISDANSPIDISTFSPGIYFLRTEHNGNIGYSRFVKK